MKKFIKAAVAVLGISVMVGGMASANVGEYKNIINLDRFETALADQAGDWATYRNIIDIDRFTVALSDQQVTGGAYKNIVNLDRFVAALGDQRMKSAAYEKIIEDQKLFAGRKRYPHQGGQSEDDIYIGRNAMYERFMVAARRR